LETNDASIFTVQKIGRFIYICCFVSIHKTAQLYWPAKSASICADVNASGLHVSKNRDEGVDEAATSEK
jgi:hypothetical protein